MIGLSIIYISVLFSIISLDISNRYKLNTSSAMLLIFTIPTLILALGGMIAIIELIYKR